jgi:hypothetical protein
MPLDWKEIGAGPERRTLPIVWRRLRRLRIDPWAAYWTASQRVSKASIAALRRL